MEREAETTTPGVRAANWGDHNTRELMRYVATYLATRSGFKVCAIAVVRPDDHHELVTVAGDNPGGKALVGTGGRMADVRRAFRDGVDHGTFTFIRAEDMSPETLSMAVDSEGYPDIPVPEHPGEWHPLDVLVAQVRDGAGETRALVYLTVPEDSQRPGAERIAEITETLRVPLRAVLTVIEHESFTQHVRLLSVVRRLLHTGRRHDEQDLARLAADGLREAFSADSLEVQLFGEGWTGPLSDGLGPDLRDALTESAVRACAAGAVVIIEPGHVWGDPALRPLEPELTGLVRSLGATTVVLAPVGARGKAVGLLLISRGPRGRRWTDAESAAIVDFGVDLGQCLLEARAARRERDMLEQLQWHESLRRNFANTIVHEFKTPLTVIRANAELLESSELPEGASAKLEAIDRGVSRLATLVGDLVTLAKVTDPTRQLLAGPVDLGQVLDDVASTMRPVAERASVRLDHAGGPPGLLVTGDFDELSTAVTNIVDNAIKYSAPGGSVRTWLAREEGRALFGCRDDGLGISEADQEAIFTPFFRSTNPEALARPGTGLGLDIVKSIVERHGGQITFDSELGSGTTVRIVLPALSQAGG